MPYSNAISPSRNHHGSGGRCACVLAEIRPIVIQQMRDMEILLECKPQGGVIIKAHIGRMRKMRATELLHEPCLADLARPQQQQGVSIPPVFPCLQLVDKMPLHTRFCSPERKHSKINALSSMNGRKRKDFSVKYGQKRKDFGGVGYGKSEKTARYPLFLTCESQRTLFLKNG